MYQIQAARMDLVQAARMELMRAAMQANKDRPQTGGRRALESTAASRPSWRTRWMQVRVSCWKRGQMLTGSGASMQPP
eukprot:25417-Pelagomonas_calceolata.AAC.2